MEQKEIEEGNKRIAEFYDLEKRDSTSVLYERYNWNGCLYPIHKLQFHSSYDWLMPVVEKIEDMGWTIIVQKGLCHIFSDDFPKLQQEFANKSNTEIIDKIELCWLSLVEFIRWHNNKLISSQTI